MSVHVTILRARIGLETVDGHELIAQLPWELVFPSAISQQAICYRDRDRDRDVDASLASLSTFAASTHPIRTSDAASQSPLSKSFDAELDAEVRRRLLIMPL